MAVDTFRYIPTPDSTPDNVTVTTNRIEPPTQQQMCGNCSIWNRVRLVVGETRIQSAHITTDAAFTTGATNIRNPLQFLPGFQIAPLLTNTELTIQWQDGVASIWVSGEQQTTQMVNGVANVQVTLQQLRHGVANIQT